MCFNHFAFIFYTVFSFIAMFYETEYEFDISIYSSTGTVVFEALFILNPNVTVEFLSFDIITTDEFVGETTNNGDFLINGITPPLVIQAPYQSVYFLAITVDNVLDTNDTTDVTFDLFAFVRTSTGIVAMPTSNVTLHKIGKEVLLCICDQICQRGPYTRTVSRHTFHCHLLATTMHQQHNYVFTTAES